MAPTCTGLPAFHAAPDGGAENGDAGVMDAKGAPKRAPCFTRVMGRLEDALQLVFFGPLITSPPADFPAPFRRGRPNMAA